MVPGSERTVRVHCPLCSGDGVEPFLDCGGFRFVRCDSCGLVRQDPQPVFDDLRERYDEEYFRYEIENERNFFQLMLLGLQDIRFERSAEAIPAEGRRFLDIGCATGMLLEHMRVRGWQVQGVEICRPSAEYGIRTRGVPIHIGPLEEARFPEGSFRTVHFSHLIEHVNDPRAFLGEVYRVLAPGGQAVIVTPNVKGLQARLLGPKWRSAIADHLFLFDPISLGRLLGEVGFRTVAVKTWGGIARGLAPAWIKGPLDRLAKRFGFGDVMLFLAEKPGDGAVRG